LSILVKKIHDGRFLRDRPDAQGGVLEVWHWHAPLSDSPQGGAASPVLSNIYLDRFHQYIEQWVLPEYHLDNRRRRNREYQEVESAIARACRHGDRTEMHRLVQRRCQIPSQHPTDPGHAGYGTPTIGFRGFAGHQYDAETIKSKIALFPIEELNWHCRNPNG
jgi:hypothetical protein